jgi:hypothetical protein
MSNAQDLRRIQGVTGRLLSSGALLVAMAGHALALDNVEQVPVLETAASMLERFPGLLVNEQDDQITLVGGIQMSEGATAQEAVNNWLARYGTVFGVGRLDGAGTTTFDERYITPIRGGKAVIFDYAQRLEGVPVEHGMLKMRAFAREDGSYSVVMASAKLAAVPEGGFKDVTVTGEQAIAGIRAMPEYKSLPSWSEPEMVVYQAEGDKSEWITPTLSWKFVGEMPVGAFQRKFTFFVDAASNELLHARNEILHVDVTGSVRARATPFGPNAATADHAGNPPVSMGVPNIRVRINGSNTNSAFTDADGNFTIPWTGTAPVTVDASVGDGRWTRVIENLAGQALMTASATATPGTPVTLNLNPAPGSQYTNAQLNAFIHSNSTRDFFVRYAPAFTGLNAVLPANTTVSGSCNAFYNGTSTNYYAVGGSCNNTAFSSVVAHEYGHHIVNRLGLAQGGFGEGFGDLMSILQYDDLVVGRFFQTSGGSVRTPDSANQQFPCTGCAVHTSGLILGGVICEVRKSFGVKFGSAPGLETVRALTMEWALSTLGGDGDSSASPRTLNEFLIADDIDGNISNGTPNYCELVGAFGQHNIQPTASTGPINVAISPAVPSRVESGESVTFNIDASGICRVPVAGTGRAFARRGAETFAQVPLTQTGPNSYSLTMEGPTCSSGALQFYLRFNVTNTDGSNNLATFFPSPTGVSPVPFTVDVGSLETVVSDTFQTDTGWTVGPDSATAGNWVRVDPNPTNIGSAPGDDATPGAGTIAWVTGQGTDAASAGQADVDGGVTILTSPSYNVAGASDATISYKRWYSNGLGATPFTDTFLVDVSTNNGVAWTRAETVGPGSATDVNVLPGWRSASWNLRSLGLTPTPQVRVRFTAQDTGTGSLVEAGIDDFMIERVVCNNPICPADFNQDGGVDGMDVTDFFDAWAVGDQSADFNQDGGVDGTDVEGFFIRWSAGC